MKYGIRTEQVTIDQELYTIKPLKGEFYAEFMGIATIIQTKLAQSKKDNPDLPDEELLIALSQEDYSSLQKLAVETLMASDAGANRAEIEGFASQNLMPIVTVMLKVNSPKEA